jgi:hypothetical protein
MISYYENHVFPKVKEYLSNYFSVFILQDYFEQVRIALREQKYTEASTIVF